MIKKEYKKEIMNIINHAKHGEIYESSVPAKVWRQYLMENRIQYNTEVFIMLPHLGTMYIIKHNGIQFHVIAWIK